MKRLFALILALATVLALSGCVIRPQVNPDSTPPQQFHLIKSETVSEDYSSFTLDWKTGGLLYSVYGGDSSKNVVQIKKSETGTTEIFQYASAEFKLENAFTQTVENGVLMVKDSRTSSIYDDVQHPSFTILSIPEKVFEKLDIEVANCTFSAQNMAADWLRFKLGAGAALLTGNFKTQAVDIVAGAAEVTNTAENVESIRLHMTSGAYTSVFTQTSSMDLKLISGAATISGDAKAAIIDVAAGALEYNGVAGDMNVKMASGRISVNGSVSGNLVTNLLAGDISISSNTMLASADVSLTAGSCTLALPANNPGFTAKVDKASGTFSSGFNTTQNGDSYVFGDGSVAMNFNILSGSVAVKPMA